MVKNNIEKFNNPTSSQISNDDDDDDDNIYILIVAILLSGIASILFINNYKDSSIFVHLIGTIMFLVYLNEINEIKYPILLIVVMIFAFICYLYVGILIFIILSIIYNRIKKIYQ